VTVTHVWTPALSDDEAAELSGRVAELAAAGLPLHGGLRAAAREVASRRLARAMNELVEKLESGTLLPQALEEMRGRLPAHLHGLMLVGLRSGQFAQMLEQFVWQHQQARAVRRQAWLALSYPVLLLSAVIVLIPIFGVYVVGEVASIAEEYNANLPFQTQLLAGLGEFGWLAPMGSLVFLALTALAIWCLSSGRMTRPAAGQVPVLGMLWRWTALAQYCRLVALVVEHGVPLPEALELSATGVRDAELVSGSRALAAAVAAGHPLAVAVSQTRPFPPTMASVVAWGEQGQALADSLRAAADVYEERARTQVALIRTIVPPLVFLLVLGAMVFLLVATVSPMYAVIKALT
jgi:type II secretory pathway component PulF